MAESLRGIKEFADRSGGWNLVTSPPALRSAGEENLHLSALKSWRGEGVIACLTTRHEERFALRLPFPVVNLSGWQPPQPGGLPRVNADHEQMGRLAAEHFMSIGLHHFAYYGMQDPWYSRQRETGFQTRLKEAGKSCWVYNQKRDDAEPKSWLQRHAPLQHWLKKLPKPVGVFAVQDYRARVIVEFCERLHLKIPDDVAILGVDNDLMTCDYCVPSLSSISRNPCACGVAAAHMLDDLMQGRRRVQTTVMIPPIGVIQRRSTDRLYDDDPLIRRVSDYLAMHLDEGDSVATIAHALKVSRRLLELRFRERLGLSPHAYLHQRRIAQAKILLLNRKYDSVRGLAETCGFKSVRVFRDAFRALTGTTPADYAHAVQATLLHEPITAGTRLARRGL